MPPDTPGGQRREVSARTKRLGISDFLQQVSIELKRGRTDPDRSPGVVCKKVPHQRKQEKVVVFVIQDKGQIACTRPLMEQAGGEALYSGIREALCQF